ncbi:MAG TPA: alpha/beta hydrolase [Acidimicrobiia bacterium]|nr:alpha/beta hydrolase [Acidimicrobiia bacterium]
MRTHRVQSSVESSVSLHVEEVGSGPSLLFIHEFAGDHRSWEPQVRHFSRRFRCVTYAARGYPPSAVPDELSSYSQELAVQDAFDVITQLELAPTHVVGLSMGGFCALHLAREYPEMVQSAAIGGVGYGAAYKAREAFRRECEVIARAFEDEGSAQVAIRYAVGPARVQFQNKDPRGHAEFQAMLAGHSSVGSALTMRGFQKERPSLFDFESELAGLSVPLLIMVGDEDGGAVDTSLALKRLIPSSGLVVFPRSGHTLNLEEPSLFNTTLETFVFDVISGGWRPRDPRSLSSSTTGMDERSNSPRHSEATA